MTFAAFGCALDVLDAPEKLAIKLAYINALRESVVEDSIARDPYDLLTRELSDTPGGPASTRLTRSTSFYTASSSTPAAAWSCPRGSASM